MTEANVLPPTEDERTMATLAHALSLIGFIAPLVIFLIKRQSRFVSFHALQAVLLHVAYFVMIMVLVVAWVAMIALTIFHTAVTAGAAKDAPPPVGLFMLIPVLWLGFAAGGIFMIVIAIVYAVKASQGEWADYPVVGKMARKILKIGPGGALITPQT